MKENNLLKRAHYNIVGPLIPFTGFTYKYSSVLEDNPKIIEKIQSWTNIMLSTVTLLAGIGYGIGSCENRSLNYKKWTEISEEKENNRVKSYKKYHNEVFKSLDQNLDGIIDSTEYMNRQMRNYEIMKKYEWLKWIWKYWK